MLITCYLLNFYKLNMSGLMLVYFVFKLYDFIITIIFIFIIT